MEEINNFKKILTNLHDAHKEPLKDNDVLPYRLLSFFLIEEEVEAEVADWVLQYLVQEKTPILLASLLSRKVSEDVSLWDLKPYLQSLPSTEDESNIETKDVDSDDTDDLEENNVSARRHLEIEVSRLAKDVYNHLHKLCKEWGQNFPEDILKSHDCSGGSKLPNNIVAISSHAIKNTRRKMEDRHLILPYFNLHCGIKDSIPQSLFTVFDGHGGSEAAIYSAAHLHTHFARHSHLKSKPEVAIKEAFAITDEKFVKKAKREQLRSGSTVISAYIRESKLYVAWLGDSQMVLVRDGTPQKLMEPHKPERPDEKKRIEDLGGFVLWFGQWRVNATLSVSRAIGDADFKPYISSEPDLHTVDLTGDEEYMVLGCDGLWDTMNYDDVANEVYAHLHGENAVDKSKIAEKLVTRAKEKGSGDNISVIVVFFKEQVSKPKPMPKEEKKEVKNENEADKEGDDNKNQSDDEKLGHAGGCENQSGAASTSQNNSNEDGKSTEDEKNKNEKTEISRLCTVLNSKNIGISNPQKISVSREVHTGRKSVLQVTDISFQPYTTGSPNKHRLVQQFPAMISGTNKFNSNRPLSSSGLNQVMLSSGEFSSRPKPVPYNVLQVLLQQQKAKKLQQSATHVRTSKDKEQTILSEKVLSKDSTQKEYRRTDSKSTNLRNKCLTSSENFGKNKDIGKSSKSINNRNINPGIENKQEMQRKKDYVHDLVLIQKIGSENLLRPPMREKMYATNKKIASMECKSYNKTAMMTSSNVMTSSDLVITSQPFKTSAETPTKGLTTTATKKGAVTTENLYFSDASSTYDADDANSTAHRSCSAIGSSFDDVEGEIKARKQAAVKKRRKNGKKRGISQHSVGGLDSRRCSRDRLSLGIAERAKSCNTSSSSSQRSLSARTVLAARYSISKQKHEYQKHVFKSSQKPQQQSKPVTAATKADLITSSNSTNSHEDTRNKQNLDLKIFSSSTTDKKNINNVKKNSATKGSGSSSTYNRGISVGSNSGIVGGNSNALLLDTSPTTAESKWTVAREIENAAAMFAE